LSAARCVGQFFELNEHCLFRCTCLSDSIS
jgi:hypothetical protein